MVFLKNSDKIAPKLFIRGIDMKLLQKSVAGLLMGAMVAGFVNAADEFVMLPVLNDPTFKPNIEVALVGGAISFSEGDSDTGSIFGVEASVDCPIFTLPGNNPLRQQFSVNSYSDTGVDILTLEVNPYYFVDLTEDMVLGFGPGFGGAKVDVDGTDSEWAFTYQVGTGVKYYMDKFLVGADIRYQGTTSDLEIDNTRAMLKVGYRF